MITLGFTSVKDMPGINCLMPNPQVYVKQYLSFTNKSILLGYHPPEPVLTFLHRMICLDIYKKASQYFKLDMPITIETSQSPFFLVPFALSTTMFPCHQTPDMFRLQSPLNMLPSDTLVFICNIENTVE